MKLISDEAIRKAWRGQFPSTLRTAVKAGAQAQLDADRASLPSIEIMRQWLATNIAAGTVTDWWGEAKAIHAMLTEAQ